jgi:hypothetical protein
MDEQESRQTLPTPERCTKTGPKVGQQKRKLIVFHFDL